MLPVQKYHKLCRIDPVVQLISHLFVYVYPKSRIQTNHAHDDTVIVTNVHSFVDPAGQNRPEVSNVIDRKQRDAILFVVFKVGTQQARKTATTTTDKQLT